MKTRTLIGSVCLLALAGCGLEGFIPNAKHRQYDRPASTIRGRVPWATADAPLKLAVIDGAGVELAPFWISLENGRYEIRLPSARYSMLRVRAEAGNLVARAIVPYVGEESAVEGVDLDARGITEDLIVEASLSAQATGLGLVTPAAFAGDPRLHTGARSLIRDAFDATSATTVQAATQALLHMVERILAKTDVYSGVLDPTFFREPQYLSSFAVTTSALDGPVLFQPPAVPFDYDGVTGVETSADKFDRKLAEVASYPRFDPTGCVDPRHVRAVFSVDFNAGALNGNCGAIDRFKWAKDAPGKRMYFVGWIHKESAVQDPAINTLVGASTPNQIPMYDDGTNGDEVAGDNIWTISFDLPYDPARPLRLGYKYTWGFRGALWNGSEEWPGNSRIIEIRDLNGDGFVTRRDVFGDEATNKDNANLNLTGPGVISWDTVILGAAAGCTWGGVPIPEAREMPATLHSACTCTSWPTPHSIGPLKVACGP